MQTPCYHIAVEPVTNMEVAYENSDADIPLCIYLPQRPLTALGEEQLGAVHIDGGEEEITDLQPLIDHSLEDTSGSVHLTGSQDVDRSTHIGGVLVVDLGLDQSGGFVESGGLQHGDALCVHLGV